MAVSQNAFEGAEDLDSLPKKKGSKSVAKSNDPFAGAEELGVVKNVKPVTLKTVQPQQSASQSQQAGASTPAPQQQSGQPLPSQKDVFSFMNKAASYGKKPMQSVVNGTDPDQDAQKMEETRKAISQYIKAGGNPVMDIYGKALKAGKPEAESEELLPAQREMTQATAKAEIDANKQVVVNFLKDNSKDLENMIILNNRPNTASTDVNHGEPFVQPGMADIGLTKTAQGNGTGPAASTLGQNLSSTGIFSKDNFASRLLDPTGDPRATTQFRAGALDVLQSKQAKEESEYIAQHSAEVDGGLEYLPFSERKAAREQLLSKGLDEIRAKYNDQRKDLTRALGNIAYLKSVNRRIQEKGSDAPLDPLEIGMEVRGQLGDGAKVDKDIARLKAGKKLDPDDAVAYELEGYRAKQFAMLENYGNDRLAIVQNLAAQVKDYQKKILADHPDFERNQVIRAISSKYYENHDGITSALFGSDPTQEDIDEISKELGFDKLGIRRITPDDIQSPKAWYKRAAGKFIETGASGIYKLLLRSAGVANDELGGHTNWDFANEYLDHGWYENNDTPLIGGKTLLGKSPDNSGLFGSATVVDTDPLSQDYLFNKQNPNAGKYRWDIRAMLNQVGESTGSLGAILAGAGAFGKLYEAGSLLSKGGQGVAMFAEGTAEAAAAAQRLDRIALTGSTFLTGYADSYSEAVHTFPEEEGGDNSGLEAKRNLYAMLKTGVSALAMQVLPHTKVGQDLLHPGTVAGDDLISYVARNGVNNVDRTALGRIVSQAIKLSPDYAKAVSIGNIDQLGQGMIDALLAPEKYATSDQWEIQKQSAISGMIGMALPVLGAPIAHAAFENKMQRAMLWEAGSNPQPIIDQITAMVKDGKMDPNEGNQRIAAVNTMADIVDKHTPLVSPENGLTLTPDQQQTYAQKFLVETMLSKQAETTGDEVAKKAIEKRINQLRKERGEILEQAGNRQIRDRTARAAEARKNSSSSQNQNQNGNEKTSQESGQEAQEGNQKEGSGLPGQGQGRNVNSNEASAGEKSPADLYKDFVNEDEDGNEIAPEGEVETTKTEINATKEGDQPAQQEGSPEGGVREHTPVNAGQQEQAQGAEALPRTDSGDSPVSGERGQEGAKEKVASVPVMITKRMEADLRDAGYKQGEIDKMTPAEAHEELTKGAIQSDANKVADEWEKKTFTPEEIKSRREYGLDAVDEYETTYRGVSNEEWKGIQAGEGLRSEGLNDKAFVTPSKELAASSGKGTDADLLIEFKPEAKKKMAKGDQKFESQEYYGKDLSLDDVERVTTKDGKVVYEAPKQKPAVQPEQPAVVEPIAVKEEVKVEEPAKTGTTFATAKGSTYDVHEDGSTTRNKAARPDFGHEGQEGPQPRSEKTVYLTRDEMNKLDLVQATSPNDGEHFVIAHLPGGKVAVGIKTEDGEGNHGKVIPRTIVEPKTEPEVGLYPLETMGDAHHFGNEITAVNKPGAEEPATPAKPAPIVKGNTEIHSPAAGETIESQELKDRVEDQKLRTGDAVKRRENGSYIDREGNTYTRNPELSDRPTGKGGAVRFTHNESEPFAFQLIEASDLQPSHMNGRINPRFFIPEAQPKDRRDDTSKAASESIANNPDLGRLGDMDNAYFGAPVVNSRGEVIQGNNRSEALKKHYEKGMDSYKDQLINDAEKFGFTPEQVDGMKEPVLVRKVAADDNRAIELGQYDVKDLETGGNRRIDPVTTSRRIPYEKKMQIAKAVIGDGEEDLTLKNAIRKNYKRAMNLLKDYITPTQFQTLNNGTSVDGISDIEKLITHFLFEGGDNSLPVIFNSMKDVQQKNILNSLPEIFGPSPETSLIPDMQEVIKANGEFETSGAGGKLQAWLNQPDLFQSGKTPEQRYTPLEIKMLQMLNAETNSKPSNEIQTKFRKYGELVRGKAEDLLGPAELGMPKAEAIRQTFDVPYNDVHEQQGEEAQPRIAGSSEGGGITPDREEVHPGEQQPAGDAIDRPAAAEPAAGEQPAAVEKVIDPKKVEKELKPKEKKVVEKHPEEVKALDDKVEALDLPEEQAEVINNFINKNSDENGNLDWEKVDAVIGGAGDDPVKITEAIVKNDERQKENDDNAAAGEGVPGDSRPEGDSQQGDRPAIRTDIPASLPDVGRGDSSKPRLTTVGANLIPAVRDRIPDGLKEHLAPHQQQGVNLALDAFEKGKKAFLLADGPGSGKTRGIIAFAELSPEPVTIVTENPAIINGSFKDDAKSMGLSFVSKKEGTLIGKHATIVTKEQFRSGKYPKTKRLVFDESQNASGLDSVTFKALQDFKGQVLYASATPFDNMQKSLYIVPRLLGITEKQYLDEIGGKIIERPGRGRELQINDGPDLIHYLVDAHRQLVADGQLVSRYYPFHGNDRGSIELRNDVSDSIGKVTTVDDEGKPVVNNHPNAAAVVNNMSLSDAEGGITAYYDRKIKIAQRMGPTEDELRKGMTTDEKVRQLREQKNNELRKLSDTYKATHEMAMTIKRDLGEGKQVVIYSPNIKDALSFNYAEATEEGDGEGAVGSFTYTRPSFFRQVGDLLQKEGIPFEFLNSENKDKAGTVANFQDGRTKVLVINQTGTTGINLNDTKGDAPRIMYVVGNPPNAIQYDQLKGRISRLNNASKAEVVKVENGGQGDFLARQKQEEKAGVMNAFVKGEMPNGHPDKEAIDMQAAEAPRIEELNDKQFVVVNTRAIRAKMEEMGGNHRKDKNGWAFPNAKRAKVEEFLKQHEAGEAQPAIKQRNQGPAMDDLSPVHQKQAAPSSLPVSSGAVKVLADVTEQMKSSGEGHVRKEIRDTQGRDIFKIVHAIEEAAVQNGTVDFKPENQASEIGNRQYEVVGGVRKKVNVYNAGGFTVEHNGDGKVSWVELTNPEGEKFVLKNQKYANQTYHEVHYFPADFVETTAKQLESIRVSDPGAYAKITEALGKDLYGKKPPDDPQPKDIAEAYNSALLNGRNNAFLKREVESALSKSRFEGENEAAHQQLTPKEQEAVQRPEVQKAIDKANDAIDKAQITPEQEAAIERLAADDIDNHVARLKDEIDLNLPPEQIAQEVLKKLTNEGSKEPGLAERPAGVANEGQVRPGQPEQNAKEQGLPEGVNAEADIAGDNAADRGGQSREQQAVAAGDQEPNGGQSQPSNGPIVKPEKTGDPLTDAVNEHNYWQSIVEKKKRTIELAVDSEINNPDGDRYRGSAKWELDQVSLKQAQVRQRQAEVEANKQQKADRSKAPYLGSEQWQKDQQDLKSAENNARKAQIEETKQKGIKIADKIRKAKIKGGDKLLTTPAQIPVALWNAAVETVALAVEAGAHINAAVQTGVDYVNNHHFTQWDEKEFRKQLGEGQAIPPTAAELRGKKDDGVKLHPTNRATADALLDKIRNNQETLFGALHNIDGIRHLSPGVKAKIKSYIRDYANAEIFKSTGDQWADKHLQNNNYDFKAAMRDLVDDVHMQLLGAADDVERENINKKYAAAKTVIESQETSHLVETGQITPKYKKDPDAEPTFGLSEHNWKNSFKENFFDQKNRLVEAQKVSNDVITDANDAVKAMTLAPGVAHYLVKELQDELGNGEYKKGSLFDRMKDDGIDIRRMGLFAYAEHTPEANAKIARDRQLIFDRKLYELNDRLATEKDPTKAGKLQTQIDEMLRQDNPSYPLMPDGGSGMTNKQAEEIMQAFHDDGKHDIYQSYVDEFREKVVSKILEYKHDSGLIDDTMYNTLRNTFKKYVPLKVDMEGEELTPDQKKSNYAKIKDSGRDIYRRYGSVERGYDERNNPALQSIHDLETSIRMGEANKAHNVLAQLVRENPNPAIWEIRDAQHEVLNDAAGNVIKATEINRPTAPAIEFRENGKKKYIIMHDPGLQKLTKAIGMNGVARVFNKATQIVRATNTLYNPDFIVKNPLMDYGDAWLNLVPEENKEILKNFQRYAASAGKVALQLAFGGEHAEWKTWEDRAEKAGGMITFTKNMDITESAKKTMKLYEKYHDPLGAARIKHAFRAVENVTSALEKMTRTVVFRSAIEAGESDSKAAMLSRNATVDFEKKGYYGAWINAFKAFANASIQGLANLSYSAMKSKKVRGFLMSMVGAGFAEAAMNDALGDCKDAKRADCWWEVPEYRKMRNFTIPTGGHIPVSLPLPRQFAWFNYLGKNLYALTQGQMDGGQFLSNSVSSLFDFYNPAGGSAPMSQQILGNLAPMAGIGSNQNSFGGPIFPDNKNQPNHQDMWEHNTPVPYQHMATFLSEISGGKESEGRAGKIEISPNELEYVVQNTFGGVYGSLRNLTFSGPKDMADPKTGHHWENKHIPIVRVFSSESDMAGTKERYYKLAKFAEENLLTDAEDKHLNAYTEELVKSGQWTEEQRGKALKYVQMQQSAVRRNVQKHLPPGSTDGGGAKGRWK